MPDNQEVSDTLGEIEQNSKRSEALLHDAQGRSTAGWVMITVCIFLLLSNPGGVIFKIFAVLYLGFNIWRLYSAENDKRKIEKDLQGYRDKKARLTNSSTLAE